MTENLRTNVAAAILSAREAGGQGNHELANQYLDLALIWLDVPKEELARKLARVNGAVAIGGRTAWSDRRGQVQ